MSERLIDKVAEAETPLDALNAVRDWLEHAGMPTAAMAIHREGTDTSRDWRSAHNTWGHRVSKSGISRTFQVRT